MRHPVLVPLAAVALMLSGCATSGTNLVDDKTVSLRIKKAEKVYISGVKVRAEEGVLVVSGRVRARPSARIPIDGHIDVSLIGTGGQIPAKVGVLYIPRRLPRRRITAPKFRRPGTRSSRFEARFPTIPLKGAEVLVEFHNADAIVAEEHIPIVPSSSN